MTLQQVQIRQWKDGETLENLAVGDIALFCNTADMIDGHFAGLYDGKNLGKYVVYSRQMCESKSKNVLLWQIGVKGFVRGKYFLFDADDDRFVKVELLKEGENYEALNRALEVKGL